MHSNLEWRLHHGGVHSQLMWGHTMAVYIVRPQLYTLPWCILYPSIWLYTPWWCIFMGSLYTPPWCGIILFGYILHDGVPSHNLAIYTMMMYLHGVTIHHHSVASHQLTIYTTLPYTTTYIHHPILHQWTICAEVVYTNPFIFLHRPWQSIPHGSD